MFETSRDILNWVLAISIGLFTFFLCYFLLQLIGILRKINQAVEDVKDRFDKLHQALEEKLGFLSIAGKGVELVMNYLAERKEGGSKKKKH